MLADLAERIMNHLNTLPENNWEGMFKIPRDFKAQLALDPLQMFQKQERSLWVCPIYLGYSLNQKRGTNVLSYQQQPTISVVISSPFSSFNLTDVAEWREVKGILDFREEVDTSVITYNAGISLREDGVSCEPPVEVELNGRWFLSITEFTYETQVCG